MARSPRNIFSLIKQKKVTIEPYNPVWATEFNKLKEVYKELLYGLIIQVEHVGSTAVEGLLAKPVLDIDIVLNSMDELEPVKQILINAGYSFEGDKGIEGRYAFRQTTAFTPATGDGYQWMRHHLYVCLADNLALTNHLLLRDVLRNQPALRDKYAEIKKQLAAANKSNRNAYMKGKTDFIISILSANGMGNDEIEVIRKQNE